MEYGGHERERERDGFRVLIQFWNKKAFCKDGGFYPSLQRVFYWLQRKEGIYMGLKFVNLA